ncbi:MAG: HAD family hydrolase [Deltaproteobacteria bacterium]|nr:MAG: HAD family hydrolase [Deltaproteobacteria bacterium]
MPVKLVIFDCDGVLFESEQANIAFYNAVLERAGEPPLPVDGEAACHALSSAQLFEKYYGDRPALLARIREIAQSIDYGPFYPLMKPRPGLREVLEQLRRHCKTALATNRGKTVSGVLEYFGISDLFDLAVGVLDVERPKPHPDLLVRCLEAFDVAPPDALYVGDQEIDERSARAAGVRFVAMGPAAPDGDARIERIEELLDLVAGLSRFR